MMSKSNRKRLEHEHNPLIDGNRVTFIWLGGSAPNLVGDFSGWEDGSPIEMTQSKPGVWTCQMEFPWDAYIEYAFFNGEENIPDPYNPRRSSNGMGGFNHYFSMPQHKPTTLSQKNRNVPHGNVTSFRVPTDYFITGKERTIHLYQPPVNQPAPLLLVWDGQDYLKRARLDVIVDNLIAQGRVQPLALALVDNGGQKTRHLEYSCSDATLGFVQSRVLPLATENLNLVDIHKNPGCYGVVGASMGGLMALYTGVRMPKIFGNVLSQSGAFSWAGLELVIFDLLAQGKKQPLNIWMDVGNYDIPGLLESNRKMNSLLNDRGYLTMYREYPAGHNYPAWRDEIWMGLEYCYAKKI
jgi:enterochelin esterase family protein